MIRFFRLTAALEGISLLLLLFIAMPLKYIWEAPQMVQIVGMAHGLLFIAYVMLLILVIPQLQLKAKAVVVSFFCAFIPFGTFYADKRYFKSQD